VKFACPHCRQHLESDDSLLGAAIDCPVCGKSFVVEAPPVVKLSAPPPPPASDPAPPPLPVAEPVQEEPVLPPPPSPEAPKPAAKFRVVSRPQAAASAAPPPPASKFRVVSRAPAPGRPAELPRNASADRHHPSGLHERFNDFAGLEKLEGFSLGALFSEIFGKHNPEDIEEMFTVGTPRATPPIGEVDTSWPRPWLFFRALAASIVMYLLFSGGYDYFENLNLIPGMLLMGTLAVPFSTLLFFYEVNVRRNISLYQVLRLFFFGGILSLLIALVFFEIAGDTPKGLLAQAAPGPIEETGKLLALLMVARSARYPYKLNGLLMGAAIGTGFAMFESMGYALNFLLMGFYARVQGSTGISPIEVMKDVILTRGVLSPLGHIVWTAIAGAALWRVKGTEAFRFSMLGDGKFWHLFLIPVVLHSLWDMELPVVDKLPYFGKYLLLGFVAWFVVLALVQEGLKELRAEKMAALEANDAEMGESLGDAPLK